MAISPGLFRSFSGFGTPPQALWNVDETLATIREDLVTLHRVHKAGRAAAAEKGPRFQTIGSVTPFVSAAGECALIVYCLKAKEGQNVTFNVPITMRCSFLVFFIQVQKDEKLGPGGPPKNLSFH